MLKQVQHDVSEVKLIFFSSRHPELISGSIFLLASQLEFLKPILSTFILGNEAARSVTPMPYGRAKRL